MRGMKREMGMKGNVEQPAAETGGCKANPVKSFYNETECRRGIPHICCVGLFLLLIKRTIVFFSTKWGCIDFGRVPRISLHTHHPHNKHEVRGSLYACFACRTYV